MPIAWTGRPEADRLLEQEPLALLIGLVLDQQVPMERAFSGPYELKQRLGHLDPAAIAPMPPEELDEVFRRRPALHRFPGAMARRVQALCEVVASGYGGDAGAIWRGVASGEELFRRIAALPGFGERKSRITVAVLGKRFGVRPPGWERYAADWHSIADVDSPESMARVREAKRQMRTRGRA
ncbi:MAG TPA: HhH-GPD-type base excision DNA repair protein [Candidatus Dormibacteraeota bacterium]|nr:HhH-GPD-type base excision DNA repair protein [Candidatus Dormibacteraeota bacterium]